MAGLQSFPPPDPRKERDRRTIRRGLKAFYLMLLLPFLIALWGAGYGAALIDRRADCIATRKDTSL